MSTVYIMKGLPGSGKTERAKQAMENAKNSPIKRISKDDLRAMLDNGKWSKANEKFILKARDELIRLNLLQLNNVIVDDTNLHPKHVTRIQEIAKECKADWYIIDLTEVPLEECIKWDLLREKSVGERVIRRMHKQFIAPKVEPVPYDPNLSDCIICDLDGTLALFGDANPYDRDFSQDEVNKPVQRIVEFYSNYFDMGDASDSIVILSGRSSKYFTQTVTWLRDNDINYDKFVMRREGDTRKDVIVKQEMYETHIQGKYNVLFVLDDRNSVVEMWRSLGLTCLQVAEGDF